MSTLLIPGVGEQREETAELRPHIFLKTAGRWGGGMSQTHQVALKDVSADCPFSTLSTKVAANTRGNRLFKLASIF